MLQNTTGGLRAMHAVLSVIFDFLSVDELLVASRICRSWRLAALSHQNFLRQVQLVHQSDGAVPMFADRLHYIPGEPLDVTVRVTDGVLSPELAANALLSIQMQLGRIRDLDIDFQAFPNDYLVLSALHGMLSTQAPHCRSLRLDACRSALRVPLPIQLFGGARALRCVVLGNIALPSYLPSAICDAAALELVSNEIIDIGSVLLHTSSLSVLMLDAPALCNIELIPPKLPGLTKLCLHVDTGADLERFLSSPALQVVTYIELRDCRNSTAFFAPLLLGEIELLVERNPGEHSFRAVFTSAANGITRCLTRIPLNFDDEDAVVGSGSAALAALAARIAMAIVPLEMLECVGNWMGNAFPALRAVLLDMYALQEPYSGRWDAHVLEAIVLLGGDGRLAAISPSDLHYLQNAVFCGAAPKVFCTSGLRIDGTVPLLCRHEDFAAFTRCFPTAS